jgi:small subunit ribosomal protein S4
MRLLRAKEKKERALGTKLMLKAYRSMSGKSAMVRKPYRPGVHGKNRQVFSEYKLQLMEKQKIKLTYGLNERQMKNLVKKAIASGKPIPNYIIFNLESRLDNVIYRMGVAPSRIVARQLVSVIFM